MTGSSTPARVPTLFAWRGCVCRCWARSLRGWWPACSSPRACAGAARSGPLLTTHASVPALLRYLPWLPCACSARPIKSCSVFQVQREVLPACCSFSNSRLRARPRFKHLRGSCLVAGCVQPAPALAARAAWGHRRALHVCGGGQVSAADQPTRSLQWTCHALLASSHEIPRLAGHVSFALGTDDRRCGDHIRPAC